MSSASAAESTRSHDDFAGTRTLITGAGRGLGRGLAEALIAAGAKVAVADIDANAAQAAVTSMTHTGHEAVAHRIDVTDEQSVKDCVASVWSHFGGVDLLVNNAGILSVVPVTEMRLADWRRVMDVNVTGSFLVSREIARRMVEFGIAGSIVSIASIGAKKGAAGLAHYSASKFALVGFTQSLAAELGEKGITVNAVCPGVVATPMIDKLSEGWDKPVSDLVSSQIVGRPQEPSEIAQAVRFLHSTRSVTGQAINVDGGTVFY